MQENKLRTMKNQIPENPLQCTCQNTFPLQIINNTDCKTRFLPFSYYLRNQTEQIEDFQLTSWEEILSQLGEVLLYGRADAEMPLLKSKIQTKIKKTRDLEGERKIANGKRNKMRNRESNPRLCMRPMVKSTEKKREMRL